MAGLGSTWGAAYSSTGARSSTIAAFEERGVRACTGLLRGACGAYAEVLAVEMESAGVYRTAQGRQVPVLAVRGLSDVVGPKRDLGWTRYAWERR